MAAGRGAFHQNADGTRARPNQRAGAGVGYRSRRAKDGIQRGRSLIGAKGATLIGVPLGEECGDPPPRARAGPTADLG